MKKKQRESVTCFLVLVFPRCVITNVFGVGLVHQAKLEEDKVHGSFHACAVIIVFIWCIYSLKEIFFNQPFR